MAQSVENFLMHHGVLGMHWGQRKSRPAATVSPGQKKIDKHNEAQKIKNRFALGFVGVTAGLALMRTPAGHALRKGAIASARRGKSFTRQVLVNAVARQLNRNNLRKNRQAARKIQRGKAAAEKKLKALAIFESN